MCPLCKRREASVTHHLIFGWGLRELADEDQIVIKICPECHTSAQRIEERIHDNPAAESLSKMLGQSMWESRRIAKGMTEAEARAMFIARYGKSYM